MKFVYFNDTGRVVSIHPATWDYGVTVDNNNLDFIVPLTRRVFTLPDLVNGYVEVKMWDYGASGLQIFVAPRSE